MILNHLRINSFSSSNWICKLIRYLECRNWDLPDNMMFVTHLKQAYGQFQRNGHDIQTVFCTSRHLTEEVAGFKHFSLSLSGTFKYQEHTHEISPNFIERFKRKWTHCERNGHDTKWTKLFHLLIVMKIPVSFEIECAWFWY